MSATLVAWDGERPRDAEHAAELFAVMEARAEEGALPSSPLIDRFVDEMLSIWPDIVGDDGVDSPWADGPLRNNVCGSLFVFGIIYSRVVDAVPVLQRKASELGLVLYDPGSQLVLVPEIEPGGPPPPPARRSWLRRR